MRRVFPVILSGGSGSRLWPKSRKYYPKQLHRLYGDYSMLQHTALRVSHLEPPIVVCGEEQRFMVADQLSEVLDQRPTVILEPFPKNTAPAITCAAEYVSAIDSDAIIVVLPADHLIMDEASFRVSLDSAIKNAVKDRLIAFGVLPTRPETGYGYIRTKKKLTDGIHKIEAFVEKPDEEKACQYINAGSYFWNSGMYVFSSKALLKEMQQLNPVMATHCRESVANAQQDLDFYRLEGKFFEQCESASIDYAVMERTSNAWVMALRSDWSDVGSWEALWSVGERDSQGNLFNGEVLPLDVKNCYTSDSHRLIALLGVENLVVVDTKDCVLVASKERSQDVKNLVEILEAQGRPEFEQHREVYRPWGSYDSIENGDRYKVKRITVKPGASLSLQKHYHRAEHWVVVEGTALVQKGDSEVLLSENQSIYIPIGVVHRLTNPGKFDLKLIEIQSGVYLGEDDIVRLDDNFGRV